MRKVALTLRTQRWFLALVLLGGLMMFGNLNGCGGPSDGLETDTPVASPPTEFGESIEDNQWSGWHTYQDELVDMHLLTTVSFFEYRDGLWCGELIVWLNTPGAYLAYNLGAGWVTVIDVPEDSTEQDYFNYARLYGTLSELPGKQYQLYAWMDSINDDVPATPKEDTPPMESADIFFTANFLSRSLYLDPSVTTLAEFMAYTEDYPHVERTTSIDPTTTQIDMPVYTLEYDSTILSGMEDYYCGWCMQAGDTSELHPF